MAPVSPEPRGAIASNWIYHLWALVKLLVKLWVKILDFNVNVNVLLQAWMCQIAGTHPRHCLSSDQAHESAGTRMQEQRGKVEFVIRLRDPRFLLLQKAEGHRENWRREPQLKRCVWMIILHPLDTDSKITDPCHA